MRGEKTGGRKAGTPNRKTREVAELLAELGCDPIEGMARIAQNPKASLELRGRMYAEIAPYLYAKRKSVELTANATVSVAEILRAKRMERMKAVAS